MSEEMEKMIAQAEEDLLHTYNRYQIVFDHGEGVYLFDTDGKRYLDFVAGIAVCALGYGNSRYGDALKAQIDRILHTSNYFYNVPSLRAARQLKAVSGMDRVFFTNSGAEAVEGALKAAAKHAYLKTGAKEQEIIAMEHSFHGRTYGALSVTGTAKYREGYGDLPCRTRFARYNDLNSVEALINEKTAGIILETVQGEGGLTPADPEFLSGVRTLCDANGIPLILDEVQCGMGRTGSMYAWQAYGVKPDIMTTAKALGCGVPVGAFLMTEEMAQASLAAGDHGSTYGGNSFVCAAVSAVLEIYEQDHIVEHVQEVGPYLEQRLNEVMALHPCILERRGRGLMQGLVFDRPVAPVISKVMENGLILINAGPNILRFIPPLVITKEHVDEMIAILEPAIAQTCGNGNE